MKEVKEVRKEFEGEYSQRVLNLYDMKVEGKNRQEIKDNIDHWIENQHKLIADPKELNKEIHVNLINMFYDLQEEVNK